MNTERSWFFRGLLIAVLAMQVLGILQIVHLREMNDMTRQELYIMEYHYMDMVDGLRRVAAHGDNLLRSEQSSERADNSAPVE